MFDTRKFGGYLSRLRKNADMTQSELADKLNLTRQAISRYETGDSFPDVSILVLIADIFDVTLDELINSGDPTRGESKILGNVARGNTDVVADNVTDLMNLAPLLKPNVLSKLTAGFSAQGIDISGVVQLAEYLTDESVIQLLESAAFETVSDALLEKLIPLLDTQSKGAIFARILDGSMDWHCIKTLLPYADYMSCQIEAAVIEGALPYEALALMHEARQERQRKEQNDPKMPAV